MPSSSRLPGDPDFPTFIERAIRVNHAGEYGAKRIYEGQMAVLKNTASAATIAHMAEQEAAHLRYFEEELVKRHIRPTLLFPVWHAAGFLLGAATALMGEKAAMACTVAVEEVIDEHYQQQLDQLGDQEKDLSDHIRAFQADEVAHKETALENNAIEAPLYPVLTSAIKAGSRLAIWLASRL